MARILVAGGAGFFGNEGVVEWYESNGAMPPVFSVHTMGSDGAVSVDTGLMNDEDTYIDIVSASGLWSTNKHPFFTYPILSLPLYKA